MTIKQKKEFLNNLSKDFQRLKEDKIAWQEEEAERKLWENTLLDGLEKDENIIA